jgi:hypothetical protein
MVLELKDILQINATIIAGAFIFLTLYSDVQTTPSQIYKHTTVMTIALTVLIAFSGSSLFAIRENYVRSNSMLFIGWRFTVLLLFGIFLFGVNVLTIIQTYFNDTNYQDSNITKSQSPIRTI